MEHAVGSFIQIASGGNGPLCLPPLPRLLCALVCESTQFLFQGLLLKTKTSTNPSGKTNTLMNPPEFRLRWSATWEILRHPSTSTGLPSIQTTRPEPHLFLCAHDLHVSGTAERRFSRFQRGRLIMLFIYGLTASWQDFASGYVLPIGPPLGC